MVGMAAMKMMRSTSNTSIIGVTLISFVSPPLPPEVNAIAGSLRFPGRWCLRVASDRREDSALLLADEPDDAHTVLRRHIGGVDDLRVHELLVGLEVHHLVGCPVLVDALDLCFDRRLRDGLLVQVVIPIAVDAEHLIGLRVFRMIL